MPRSNWKGFISFGLVSIPVVLYNTEDASEKVSFHQIDKRDNARIKYERINVETGKEVPWEEIAKGYEYNKETMIPVEEGELKKVAGENARNIAIDAFVNRDDIHFIDVYKTYYLIPDKNGDKGYVILREALKNTNKMGIAKVIISTKEYLAAVGCYQNALMLYLLRYHEQIRPLSEFNVPAEDLKKYKVNKKEVEIASQLIKSMSSKWQPQKYKDEYIEAVHKWAENKVKNRGIPQMPQRSKGIQAKTKGLNFIDLLKKSIGENKKGRKTTANAPAIQAKKRMHHQKRAILH